MNKIFYLKSLYKSLYCREFYFNLFFARKVSYFKYLLILAMLVAIPVSLNAKKTLNQIISSELPIFSSINNEIIDKEIEFIKSQSPEIIYKNNQFYSDNFEPTIIKNHSNEILAIIDTERKLTKSDYNNSPVILKDNELIFNDEINNIQTSLPANEVFNSFEKYFDNKNENEKLFRIDKFYFDFLSIINTPFYVILFFCFIWFLVKFLISTILYSFIVGAMLSILIKNYIFEYKLCLKISAFTLTPIVIFECVTYGAGVKIFNYTNLVYFITHIIYIYFAIESFSKIKNKIKTI